MKKLCAMDGDLQQKESNILQALQVLITRLAPGELSHVARTCRTMATAVTRLTHRRIADAAQGLERWPVPIVNQLDSCRYPWFRYTPSCCRELSSSHSWGGELASFKDFHVVKKMCQEELGIFPSSGILGSVGCRCATSCLAAEAKDLTSPPVNRDCGVGHEGVHYLSCTSSSTSQALRVPQSLECYCDRTSGDEDTYGCECRRQLMLSSKHGRPQSGKSGNRDISQQLANTSTSCLKSATFMRDDLQSAEVTTQHSINDLPRSPKSNSNPASSSPLLPIESPDREGDSEEGPPLMMECGGACFCSSDCGFRVTQQGLAVQVTVVRQPFTGWGLHALQNIQKGSFVCEYAGELLTTGKSRQRQNVYDFVECDKQRCGSALLVLREYLPSREACVRINIDATRVGNVARFINHSCDGGNLLPCLVRAAGSVIPRMVLFAKEDINKGEELTYSYGSCGGVARRKKWIYASMLEYASRLNYIMFVPDLALLHCRDSLTTSKTVSKVTRTITQTVAAIRVTKNCIE